MDEKTEIGADIELGLGAVNSQRDGLDRAAGMTILVLLLLQMTLSVSAAVFGLPLTVVTAHNAVAALLLLAVVNTIRRMSPR